MSPGEVGKLLAMVAAVHPAFVVDDVRHSAWVQLLGDLDYRLATAAVSRLLATSRFAPTVAEIREEALAISFPNRLTAAEAWGEFIDAVRRYGMYGDNPHLEALHPETRRVGDCMGWEACVLSENLDVLRSQFMRMFEQLEGRAEREALIPPALQELSRSLARELEPGSGPALPATT